MYDVTVRITELVADGINVGSVELEKKR